MEKTKIGFVLPMRVGWSDLGSWNSLWKESKKDENGNSIWQCDIRQIRKLLSDE